MAIEERFVSGPDPLVYHVQLIADEDATPDEYDCYSDEDKRRWYNDDWRFVGLVVRVEGVDAAASLWAIQHGDLAEVSITFDQIMAEGDRLDELKAEARGLARDERDRLAGLPLDD